MSELQKIQKKLEKIEKTKEKLEKQKENLLPKTYVKCFNKGCGKRTRVGNLTYIQTHYYVPPSGCTEGAYWLSGEGQFECPKCGYINRLYDRPDVVKLKNSFRNVVNFHK